MSMSLYLVRLSAEDAARVTHTPEHLGHLLFDAPPAGPELPTCREDDRFLEDYLSISDSFADDYELRRAGRPVRFPWLDRAAHGNGVYVDFECGYGNTFVLPPHEVAEVAVGLAAEGWAWGGDEFETIEHAILDFYAEAARNKLAVYGGVN